MAVNTAMHLKALTDRSDGSKQLLESVMGSFVGRLTGKGISRIAFDPPTRIKEALIKVSPPLVEDTLNRTKFNNGTSQRIWNCIKTFRMEVHEIENGQATMDDTEAQRALIVPLRATMIGDVDIEQMILKFTDDVRKQTRDEMVIMSINLLDGIPIPENDTPLASEAWKEALYGQETRDTEGRLIATGGPIPDLQEEIRATKQSVLEQEALLKRIRVIADKRGKTTTEEKKRLEAIKRWETKNSVTLLSDQSVQA